MQVGSMVLYRLSDEDVRNIKFRRARAVGWAGDHEIRAGDDRPAMVSRVVAVDVLDLRIFLNGTDDLWKPNVVKQASDDAETRGRWQTRAVIEEAPPAEAPERTLRVNPGESPRTVRAKKDEANVG